VRKVSIIPRGHAPRVTLSTPRTTYPSTAKVLAGGASLWPSGEWRPEEEIFGVVTTGSESET